MNLSFGLMGGSLRSAETERKFGTMPRTRLVCWAPLVLTASGLSVAFRGGVDAVGVWADCGFCRARGASGSSEAGGADARVADSFEELVVGLLRLSCCARRLNGPTTTVVRRTPQSVRPVCLNRWVKQKGIHVKT